MKRHVMAIFAAFLFSVSAHAGGFYIPEQGTKAMGMGNAFTGVADDASAIWFNPAGIAFQEGIVVTAGLDLIIPTNEFTSAGITYATPDETFPVPHGYISYNNKDWPVVIGFGINAPFGLTTDWTNSGAPFTAAVPPLSEGVTFSELQMANVNPIVAFKINDQLSIAAGVTYYYLNKVNLDNALILLGGDGDGWGANVAVLYKGDQFNFGVSYRSRVKADISGTATGNSGLALIGAGALIGVTSTADTSVTFPDLVNIGAAYRPNDQWLISVNVDWVNWSTFDSIDITYGASPLNGVTGPSSSIPQNWDATWTFRVGVEWDYLPNMRARIGYVYDPTPIPDADFSPRIPGNDRQLFTVGWGVDFGADNKHTLDLGYAYVLLDDRTQTASSAASLRNGLYKANAHLFAATYTGRF